MKRIVKKPDIRRVEIIRAAEKLFKEKGYVKTSVEAIINEAGIAKGTFYYYFKAKQDILRAAVENIAFEMEQHFKSIVDAENLSAIEKLKKMLRGSEKQKIVTSPVMKILHKPENRELQERLNIESIEIIAPLIAQVLQQGNKEGIFNAAVPVESIQIILAGTQFVLDSGLFHWTAKKRATLLKSAQSLLETLCGAKAGTFYFIAEK